MSRFFISTNCPFHSQIVWLKRSSISSFGPIGIGTFHSHWPFFFSPSAEFEIWPVLIWVISYDMTKIIKVKAYVETYSISLYVFWTWEAKTDMRTRTINYHVNPVEAKFTKIKFEAVNEHTQCRFRFKSWFLYSELEIRYLREHFLIKRLQFQAHQGFIFRDSKAKTEFWNKGASSKISFWSS